MDASSDPTGLDAERAALVGRVARLERVVVLLVGWASILALAVGSVRPWLEEERDGEPTSARLGLFVLQAFGADASLDGPGWLLVIAFATLTLTTVAAIICVAAAMEGSWERTWVGTLVAVLLGCCLLGAGLMSLWAGASGEGGTSTTRVLWGTYLLWALGALGAIWMMQRTARGTLVPLERRPGPLTD